MNEETRALVAKVRAQLVELNADIEALACEHGVSVELDTNLIAMHSVGAVIVPCRLVKLDFVARL